MIEDMAVPKFPNYSIFLPYLYTIFQYCRGMARNAYLDQCVLAFALEGV